MSQLEIPQLRAEAGCCLVHSSIGLAMMATIGIGFHHASFLWRVKPGL